MSETRILEERKKFIDSGDEAKRAQAVADAERKKTAAAKAKATPSVETRKNLRVATVELAVTRKAQAVVRVAKGAAKAFARRGPRE